MAKERIIYDNYDVCAMYNAARAFLLEEYNEDEITETMIWNEVNFQDSLTWQYENRLLTDFFTGHGFFLIRGFVGRWNGTFAAGAVFDNWEDMFHDATKDCDYVKIWDENGHFYLECSHHDGTNSYEIKRISNAGYNFIDNWYYNWDDERSESQIHDIVWHSNFLSSLPHFAHEIYGCKKREG